MAEGIEIQIGRLLDEYSEEVQKEVDKIAVEVAKDTANDLKNTSPKKTGKYAQGWKVKKTPHGAIVYNSSKPYLTQLLERGHVLVSYGKTRGRVGAKPHIKPAEERAQNEFTQRVERVLNK